MVLSQNRHAIGTFFNRQDAEYALKELNSAGFPMERISLLVTDREAQRGDDGMNDNIDLKVIDNTAPCASITGSMIGAIGGCLLGLGLLVLPGIGSLVAVGTSGMALAATLAGAGIGAAGGSLLNTLAGSGMNLEQAKVYKNRFSQGEYLVIVNSTDEEVRHAEYILSRSHSSKTEIL
jgi:hypothetical protein